MIKTGPQPSIICYSQLLCKTHSNCHLYNHIKTTMECRAVGEWNMCSIECKWFTGIIQYDISQGDHRLAYPTPSLTSPVGLASINSLHNHDGFQTQLHWDHNKFLFGLLKAVLMSLQSQRLGNLEWFHYVSHKNLSYKPNYGNRHITKKWLTVKFSNTINNVMNITSPYNYSANVAKVLML